MLTNGNWTYTWNAENRMVSAVNGTITIEFKYDYMGHRVEKKVIEDSVVSKHEYFVYNSTNQLLEKLDVLNTNSVMQKFIWQGEKILSLNNGTDTYYYTHNANKNVSELLDNAGSIVAHYEYSPFGKVTSSSGSYKDDNPFRFSSEYTDDKTGLVYFNFRYYASKLGRWTKRDYIEESGGINMYGMVGNNPIKYYDMQGLAKCKEKTLSKISLGHTAFSFSKSYKSPTPGWTAGGGMSFSGSVGYEEEKKCCSDCSIVTDKSITGTLALSVDFWVGFGYYPPDIDLWGYRASIAVGIRAGVKADLGKISIGGSTDLCNGDSDYAFAFDVGYSVTGYVTGEAKASLKFSSWYSFDVGGDVTGSISLPIKMAGRCDETGCKPTGTTFGAPKLDVTATICFGHCISWKLL
jgi:RHS repeat-associated protein